MNIYKPSLTFGRLIPRKNTNRIILHHTASGNNTTIRQVHAWHRARGWPGIGYHYLITASGEIEQGRPEGMIGTHTRGFNASSIAIALTGNFEKTRPGQGQVKALIWLIRDIQSRYNHRLTIHRHSDKTATLCPGRLFPIDFIMKEAGR